LKAKFISNDQLTGIWDIIVDKCQQIRYDNVNKILKDLWCLVKGE
jgi:hypothetical protein